MALASGSQNDEVLLKFVRWQADKSPFAADVQPAIGVHWVSAGGRLAFRHAEATAEGIWAGKPTNHRPNSRLYGFGPPGCRFESCRVQISFQSRFTGDFDGRRARRTAFLVCV